MLKNIVTQILILFITIAILNDSLIYAANRVALVIGNSDYISSPPLKNPVNDALDMQKVLKQVGFDVILRTNANKGQMLQAIDEFSAKLKHSQVGLFFFAGHGMQVKGDNYLIPIQAHITSETDVEYAAVNAGRVLGKMENAGNPMNIVILDACRDNPFKRSFRTSQKGLARMDAPVGSILAYATAPGSTAADGSGRNGIYTKNLIKNITQKGVSLNDVFMEVRKGVLSDTNGKQVPWEESSLTGRFYFTKPFAQASPAPVRRDIYTDPVTGMEFIWIEGGCYQMGHTEVGKQYLIKKFGWETYNKYYTVELPRHKVCVNGFWMAKYRVTNEQYRQFKPNHNSKTYQGIDLNGANQPVVYVSWNDAREYIKWLNRKTGQQFLLPTEAQWEYACRAGTDTVHYWGDNENNACQYANVPDRTAKQIWPGWAIFNCTDGYAGTAPVGSFAPNNFGLYDMLGNVSGWCEDVYDFKAYSKHAANNPLITSGGKYHIIRGGSWSSLPANIRSANRDWKEPGSTINWLGFRLCSAQVRQ